MGENPNSTIDVIYSDQGLMADVCITMLLACEQMYPHLTVDIRKIRPDFVLETRYFPDFTSNVNDPDLALRSCKDFLTATRSIAEDQFCVEEVYERMMHHP